MERMKDKLRIMKGSHGAGNRRLDAV
jgi:hypothetical protein